MMLIVREWTDIPLESEWRCFVRGKRLTAISQFYYQARRWLGGRGGNFRGGCRVILCLVVSHTRIAVTDRRIPRSHSRLIPLSFPSQVFWEGMESRAGAAKRAIIEFFPLVSGGHAIRGE